MIRCLQHHMHGFKLYKWNKATNVLLALEIIQTFVLIDLIDINNCLRIECPAIHIIYVPSIRNLYQII